MVKPIYAPLKWRDVSSYILAVGCIIAVLVVHFIARVTFRRWKIKKLDKKEKGESKNIKKVRKKE